MKKPSSDHRSESSQRRALVLLAEGAEEMEVTIIVDLLRRAKIEVVLASLERAQHVTCSRGLKIAPDALLSDVANAIDVGEATDLTDAPDVTHVGVVAGTAEEVRSTRLFDAVILPGGAGGAEQLAASPAVGEVLRRHHDAGRLIGAICAAPAALRAHGLGDGRKLTSHPSVRARVASDAHYEEASVVEDGPFITSRGPGTAFEFSLAIIRRLSGPEVADQVFKPLMLNTRS